MLIIANTPIKFTSGSYYSLIRFMPTYITLGYLSEIIDKSLFSSHGATAPCGLGPRHYQGFTITLRHTSGGEINPTHRPLPDKTQHSQDRDIHAPGGIQTRNPSKKTAKDPCLRTRGHWDPLSRYFNKSSLFGVLRHHSYKVIFK